ncbi:hypothetical protein NQ317_003184 [Molorchus minor]|uniref:Uncharacterized protein n=1 Tax=Molorchus minor TaxID=1323400 RepID=A0ABQ9JGR5_9CUCU|nr:hypothetical protein NQ317_003184 [Molorchus minor]
MGKRSRQPASSPAKRLRGNQSNSSETDSSENLQELAPVGEIASRSSGTSNAVDQLANVMRDVFSSMGNLRPSTSTGFRGESVPYFDCDAILLFWVGVVKSNSLQWELI